MTTISSNAQTLKTVQNVDLNKYSGKWYEIASYPQRFQKGCHCTTAEYTLSEKGYVIVINRCKKDSINGKQPFIQGKAFVVKNSGNAKLKVQFFWPFRGKYWIIDLSNDYLSEILLFAKPIAWAIEQSFDCNRCGISVVGLEVPHAHLHLVPINSADDLNFTRDKLKLSKEEFVEVQKQIIAAIR